MFYLIATIKRIIDLIFILIFIVELNNKEYLKIQIALVLSKVDTDYEMICYDCNLIERFFYKI